MNARYEQIHSDPIVEEAPAHALHEVSRTGRILKLVGVVGLAAAATIGAEYGASKIVKVDYNFSHIGDSIVHPSSASEK